MPLADLAAPEQPDAPPQPKRRSQLCRQQKAQITRGQTEIEVDGGRDKNPRDRQQQMPGAAPSGGGQQTKEQKENDRETEIAGALFEGDAESESSLQQAELIGQCRDRLGEVGLGEDLPE